MSAFAEEKKHFRIALVKGGQAVAPERFASKWRRQFEEVLSIDKVPIEPRLVNVFKLGADPEFVLEDVLHGVRMDAEGLGLKTGLAIGADMNGRLVEMRPEPDTFALRVVASILAELKWLAVTQAATLALSWTAGAFVQHDGLGGHVHIGRKRNFGEVRAWADWFNYKGPRRVGAKEPERPKVITALDKIYTALVMSKVFPEDQCADRQAGDAHNQRYGMPGDIRMQAYGYEYRAYASWLNSPLTAYLVLTLSKLAIMDPDLLPTWTEVPTMDRAKRFLLNLLAYYKGLDDDARIAYQAIKQCGWPVFKAGDFKHKWFGPGEVKPYKPAIFPMSIVPTTADLEEAFALINGAAPKDIGELHPNWQAKLPVGYVSALGLHKTTRGLKGIGELLWDVVVHRDVPLLITGEARNEAWALGTWLTKRIPNIKKKMRDAGEVVYEHDADETRIYVPLYARQPERLAQTKKLLLGGLFPIWGLDVTAGSYAKWFQDSKIEKPELKRYSSKVILKG